MQILPQRKGHDGRFRELAIWMIPPARGWRRKTPGLFHRSSGWCRCCWRSVSAP